MFDQILNLVKDHMGSNSEISSAIPAGQEDAVHQEIANHVANGLQSQASGAGGAGGLMSMLSGGMGSGSPITSAIEGGLVGSLGTKFGLPPLATGAIAAALPGLLQKFANKANDPNDSSITQDSMTSAFSGSGNSSGGLGGMLGGMFK